MAPWLPLLVGAVLRLVHLTLPVVGVHSWRQADTAAMARHFAQGDMLLWLPQIDWAGASPGYVESEFPLYPYLLAGLYRLFGLHEWLGRGLSLLASLLTIWVLIRLGSRLLSPAAGWWGGLFFAVLPLSTYYGRTLQAEALLLLLAALAIERLLAWRQQGRIRDLLLCWLSFTLAVLIKVLPLLWLGLPLLWLGWPAVAGGSDGRRWPRRALGPLLFLAATLAVTALWFWHAHQLGQASGLSFGFWGGDSDRNNWLALLQWRYWADLLLRTAVRGFAVVGVPLLVLGALRSLRLANRDGRVFLVGCAGVAATGLVASHASAVHEYYQLPLLLYACPLMGLACSGRGWWWASVGLLVAIALVILSLDYWRVESAQAADLAPLAERIRSQTPARARIVAVSGSDPTLLNLGRRQGWLAAPEGVSAEAIAAWQSAGASHIAGSFLRIASHEPLADEGIRQRLQDQLCRLRQPAGGPCPWPESFYVIPLRGSAALNAPGIEPTINGRPSMADHR